MLFKIPFLLWTLKAALEIEIPDDTAEYLRIKVAVELAVKQGASLVGASLDGARLDGASLDGASLDGASLDGASLVGARLDGASLDGASLDGARLNGARLDGASLNGASLNGARLDGARLDGASLGSIRADVFDILLRSIPEVPGLLAALREGRIDGSTYEGPCACLVGTIANIRGVSHRNFDFRDSSRPAERWFTGINKGDTPNNHQIAKITEGWLLEFQDLIKAAQAPAKVED